VFYDCVRETTTTTGTGNVTLDGAVADFFTLNSVIGLNESFSYCIHNASRTELEIGAGYLSSATVLVRVQVFNSTNANQLVSFTTGPKQVLVTFPAALATNIYNANIIHLLSDFR
jgi:hypothetical protein